MEKTFLINGEEVRVQDYQLSGDELRFVLNGSTYHYRLLGRDGQEVTLEGKGRFKASVSTVGPDGESQVIARGIEARCALDRKLKKKSARAEGSLVAPMPGKIFKVLKESGSEVKKGETILILEAMKMEHSIRSDKDGKVAKITYKVGELVQGGSILAEVE